MFINHNFLKLEIENNYIIGGVCLDAIEVPTLHIQREYKLLEKYTFIAVLKLDTRFV